MGRKAKTQAEKLQAQQARQNCYQLRSLNQSVSPTPLSVLPESTSSFIPTVLTPPIPSSVLHAASEQNEPFERLVNLFADAQLNAESDPEADYLLLPAEAHEESDVDLNNLLDHHSTTSDEVNSEFNELLNLSFASNHEPSTIQNRSNVADEARFDLNAPQQLLARLDSSNISSSIMSDVLEREDNNASIQSSTASETDVEEASELDQEINERLQRSWSAICSCNAGSNILNESNLGFKEMCQYWDRHMPRRNNPNDSNTLPITSENLLPRDGRHGDYRNIAWKALLAGEDGNPPSLNVARSEIEPDTSIQESSLQVSRRWDVDSMIAEVASLGVHRDGFDLAYRPPYSQRVTQNPRVTFQEKFPHHIKNQRLGRGLASAGFNYQCHVFFPHMPVFHRNGTHLTDIQQEEWIDSIIIPALRESCPNDILQHHPRSFAEIKSKATAQQEWHPTGKQQPIDLRYCIPEEYLDQFWSLVLQKCNSPRLAIFRDVFLIVQGHNLKLFTKRFDPQQVRQDYFRHLRRYFHTDERYMPAQRCWIDFGLEDTPEQFEDEAVTLLRKSKCCASWNIQFQAVDQKSSLLRTHEFPWALTRDIMSTNAEVFSTNKWHAEGGIAFNKAYNLHKDLFATPVKGLIPFDLEQLEGLAYDQDLLNRWYELRYRGGQTSHLNKRRDLLKVYQHAKQRINQSICSTIDTCFGVRQEYRMTLERFSRLQLNNALDDITVDDPHQHRPYYAFRTKDVNTYIAYDINRWLMCLEALVCQVDQGPIGLSPASAEQQMINGVMMSAIIRTLHSNLGEREKLLRKSVWLHDWKSKPHLEENESGSDEEEETDESSLRLGLNYCGSLEQTGLAWLPLDLILWEGLPTFKSDIIHRLGFAVNGFGGRLNQTLRVQNLLQQEHREFALFREWLQRSLTMPKESLNPYAREWVFQVGAELIIQSYQVEILGILRQRSKEVNPKIDIVQHRLNAIQSKGLEGFSYDLLIKLLHMPPHLILVKKTTRHGLSLLDQYNTGTWIGRIAGLFGLDDNRPGIVKKRGWEHSPFRVLKRRLQHIVKDVLGPDTQRNFDRVINLHACQKMWIIPQYDIDKLSVLRKGSKHNAPDTLKSFQELKTLARTNWIMPQLDSAYFEMFEVLEQLDQHDELLNSGLNQDWQKIHQELTTRAGQLAILAEGDIQDRDFGLVKSPMRYGIDIKLNLALEFRNQLERSKHG